MEFAGAIIIAGNAELAQEPQFSPDFNGMVPDDLRPVVYERIFLLCLVQRAVAVVHPTVAGAKRGDAISNEARGPPGPERTCVDSWNAGILFQRRITVVLGLQNAVAKVCKAEVGQKRGAHRHVRAYGEIVVASR